MSYTSRALDYVRAGMSEADAYARVAAERNASEGWSGAASGELGDQQLGDRGIATDTNASSVSARTNVVPDSPTVSEIDLEASGQLTLAPDICVEDAA